MTKCDDFLWIVQTLVLADVCRLSSGDAARTRYADTCSPDGVFVSMAEAVRVSRNIPDDLSATDAAHDFGSYILKNLRDEEESTSGHSMQVPDWLVHHDG